MREREKGVSAEPESPAVSGPAVLRRLELQGAESQKHVTAHFFPRGRFPLLG